jgi:hypothetical protein
MEGIVQGTERWAAQGLVHGVSSRAVGRQSLLPKPRLLRNFWQERAFWPRFGTFDLS